MTENLLRLLLFQLLTASLVAQVSEQDCEEKYRFVLESVHSSASDKRLAEFEFRRCGEERHLQELQNFKVSDGVDQFEAWLLADEYRTEEFGGCGRSMLPTRNGNVWKVEFGYGPDGVFGPVITVDAITGEAVCEGHSSRPVDMPARKKEIEDWLKAAAIEKSLTPEQRKERHRARIIQHAARRKIEIEKQLLDALQKNQN